MSHFDSCKWATDCGQKARGEIFLKHQMENKQLISQHLHDSHQIGDILNVFLLKDRNFAIKYYISFNTLVQYFIHCRKKKEINARPIPPNKILFH